MTHLKPGDSFICESLPLTRRLLSLAALAGLSGFGQTGCEVAPMQVTGLPEHYVRAPREMPRVPAPDPAAVELPDGYRAEIVLDRLTYPSSIEFDDNGAMYVAESGYVNGDHAAVPRVLRINEPGETPQIVTEDLRSEERR